MSGTIKKAQRFVILKNKIMETTALKIILSISSPSFQHQGFIPAEFTCDGSGKNPEIHIDGIPEQAKTLALIVEDPDAPGKIFDHWVVWNIPPSDTIYANSVPGLEGSNSRGKLGYTPPCPPSGVHRYFFKVYALDSLLVIKEGASKQTVENILRPHLVGYGELIGLYKKRDRD